MRFKKMNLSPKTNLLDLPNCLILQLLKYLDATSLYLLSRTCERLDDLIKDHKSLWRHIDARRAPNDRDKVTYCLQRAHDATHTFLVRGNNPLEAIVLQNFFKKINGLKNLTVLALENQTIRGPRVKRVMTSFPQHLKELSLKKTKVTSATDFFRFSGDHMHNLRVLILDECDWMTSSAFMAISKYNNLEILSVYKCKNIDNSIPYLSMAGQYGFKKLKIFDARLSPLGNTLLRSLYKSESLLAIYLQNQDISYKLDYFKRKLQILKGAPTNDFYVDDLEFKLNDSLTGEENGLNYEDPTSLDDKGLLDYLSTTSEENKTNLPHSFLYKDPYNCCTCCHEDHQNGNRKSPDNKKKSDSSDSSDDDDDDDDSPKDLKNTIVRELEEKIVQLTDMVRRSIVNNGWSRVLNSSAEGTLNRIPLEMHNRFQLVSERGEASGGPSANHRIIEVHLNHGQREPRKRPHEDDDEPEVKKQKIDGEEPQAGPSWLNESDDSEDESPRNPPNEELPNLQLMDFDVIKLENVENVAKENIIPLKRLSLRGYKKITDATLYFIKDVDLDLLDLTYTDVTVDGIDNYLIDHPSCRIVHEKFCICPTNLHF